MKIRKIMVLGILVLSAVLVFGTGPAAAEDVYRMKIQSAYPRGDVSMELLKYFAEQAKKRSNGRLLIAVYADPELVPAEQLFEATKKGTLDMVHALGAMWGGLLSVGEVEFGLPYAWKVEGGEKRPLPETAAEIRKFFYESGFVELLRAEYAKQGLYWLDMHTYGPLFTLATKPINTCADLQGKRFRVEGSWANYYDSLGARGTYVPGMEAYMALKLGTLDASQWDVSAIVGLNWQEVAPYWLRGTDSEHCIGHILVNQESWNKLPDDLKQALAGAAEDYWHELVRIHVDELAKVQELVKSGSVKESWIDEACRKQFAEKAYTMWDEMAKRDEAAAKAIALIKTWRGLK